MKTYFMVLPMLFLVLCGCNPAFHSPDNTADIQARIDRPSPTPESLPDGIEKASPKFIEAITAGLQEGVTVSSDSYMKRASGYKNVYFVACKLRIPKAHDAWGIWAVGPDEQGNAAGTMSADGISEGFSDWPRGDKTEAHIWFTDPDGTALHDFVMDK